MGNKTSRLLFLLVLFASATASAAPSIKNPYYPDPAWKLWATNPTPITDSSLVSPGQVGAMTPPDANNRVYPDDIVTPGKFLEYRLTDWSGRKYFGSWDDVYFSWDGTHTFMNPVWSGANGNSFSFPGRSILMLGYGSYDIKKFGTTFTSQSTTGMGAGIANNPYSVQDVEMNFYFANCLRAGPSYISYMDDNYVTMNDSYQALVPSYYNSVYASGSEMAAINKMMIAGGYLPIATKTELKRNGLYQTALLYIFKASLPYSVPYDSELRHRVGYLSGGSSAVETIEGNLYWHLYNDTDHLSNMVAMAKSMTVAPPVAILKKVAILSGTESYFLKTAALVQQAAGQTVQIRVNVNDSIDLANRALTYKWTVLYGNKSTTVVNEGGGNYLITVPSDANLPAGRTTLLMVANNGSFDSNPATVNIYRAAGATNQRPVISGTRNINIVPGGTVTFPLSGADPEGYPVSFFKRSDQPGTITGNTYTWTSPSNTPVGDYPVSILASDGTTGTNSTQFIISVTNTIARLSSDKTIGPASLAVNFSSSGSLDSGNGALSYLWDFDDGSTSTTANPQHSFANPGIYRVKLTVTGPSGSNTAESVVEAQSSWNIRVNNGWSAAGLDANAWSVVVPQQGDLTPTNTTLTLRNSNVGYPNDPFGLQSVTSFNSQLYMEADFNNGYAISNDGFEILGNKIGWNATPFDFKNATGGTDDVRIGDPGGNAELKLRVYVTPDALHAGKVRYSGSLNTAVQTFYFSIDNQSFTPAPIKYIDNFHWTVFSRLQVWAPGVGSTNNAPTASAGSNQTVTLPSNALLAGSASDDGNLRPLVTTWSKVSGPGTVSFGNANALSTAASFSQSGSYVLQLSAYDGQYTSNSSVTITVNPNPQPPVDTNPPAAPQGFGVVGG